MEEHGWDGAGWLGLLGGEVMRRAALTHPTALMDKSFLLLFFKKEGLALLPSSPHPFFP